MNIFYFQLTDDYYFGIIVNDTTPKNGFVLEFEYYDYDTQATICSQDAVSDNCVNCLAYPFCGYCNINGQCGQLYDANFQSICNYWGPLSLNRCIYSVTGFSIFLDIFFVIGWGSLGMLVIMFVLSIITSCKGKKAIARRNEKCFLFFLNMKMKIIMKLIENGVLLVVMRMLQLSIMERDFANFLQVKIAFWRAISIISFISLV